jgi:hypothetical protein
MRVFTQNDDWPPYKWVIKKVSDNSVFDLTGCTVKFPYTAKGKTTVINTGHTTCTLTDAANGAVEYRWDNHTPVSPEDLANTGIFEGEVEITFATGETYTIPAKINFKIQGEKE